MARLGTKHSFTIVFHFFYLWCAPTTKTKVWLRAFGSLFSADAEASKGKDAAITTTTSSPQPIIDFNTMLWWLLLLLMAVEKKKCAGAGCGLRVVVLCFLVAFSDA